MDSKKYKELVEKHKPKENKILNLVKAFVIGGLFGILGNFLIEFYSKVLNISSSTASVVMIVTLVFLACLFTALGFFDSFVKFGKMGVIIPITGFAHSMQSAALDSKSEGLVMGIGSNIFKLAGSVILFGVVSSIIAGIIRYFVGV